MCSMQHSQMFSHGKSANHNRIDGY
jgi:hypothetical protein